MPTTVKGCGLGVAAELAEVALDRLPGTLGGDAHLLVVVAGRAARGERVVEPEAVVAADRRWRSRRRWRCPCRRRRRDRGRRRRSGPRRAAGRSRPGVLVVGDVEQAAQERLVAADALLQERRAVAGRRRALDDEAALGAHRHDDRVLDHLRLHQAQDLGAEVLPPVGPAQAAARDLAAAQMHALDIGRVDEDLERRPRLRQARDPARVELVGHVVLGPARSRDRAARRWCAGSP